MATRAESLTDTNALVEYIAGNKYKAKPELYSAQQDVFFFIKEYPDGGKTSITVMAKRFYRDGYVVLHFYARDEIATDIAALNSVLTSLTFDEGFGLQRATKTESNQAPQAVDTAAAQPKR